MLNSEQKKAVEAPLDRHLLIIAGAGTGKTRALTHRIAHVIHRGIAPNEICAITFTNKAADEMKRRVYTLAKEHAEGRPFGFVGTFHSLGARILRKTAHLAGRNAQFSIFDERDSFSVIKKLLKKNNSTLKPGQARSLVSAYKSGRLTKKLQPKEEGFVSEYEEALKAYNAFDFDDLISKTVKLLAEHPAERDRVAGNFKFVLVDEYQDINNRQQELLRLLTKAGATLNAVGDAEQTIYTFRGSDVGIFLDFPEHWNNPTLIKLDQNYRSTRTILEAASAVISNNTYHSSVPRATNLWTNDEEGGGPIRLYSAVSANDEARWITEQLEQLPARKSIGILYRTNAQSRAIEQALIREDIPYHIFGGIKFYERREVKDVIAGLRFALHPKDKHSEERLVKNIRKYRLKHFLVALGEQNATELSPQALMELFLSSTEYFAYLEKTFSNPRERRENIEELVRFAREFGDTHELLEQVALIDQTGANDSSFAQHQAPRTAHVHLMTIHLAKGLEFDNVFVAGCSEYMLPHKRSLASKESIQEERRLMYVAMTRARKQLFLSYFDIPSRFLGEIPENHMVHDGFGGNYDDEEIIEID